MQESVTLHGRRAEKGRSIPGWQAISGRTCLSHARRAGPSQAAAGVGRGGWCMPRCHRTPGQHSSACRLWAVGPQPRLGDGGLRCVAVAVGLVPEAHIQQGIEGVVPLLVAAGSLRGQQGLTSPGITYQPVSGLGVELQVPAHSLTSLLAHASSHRTPAKCPELCCRTPSPVAHWARRPRCRLACPAATHAAPCLHNGLRVCASLEALVGSSHHGPRVAPHLQKQQRREVSSRVRQGKPRG